MNRSIVGVLVVCMALGTLTWVAGCGDDGESARARIPQSRLKPQRSLEQMTPEERAEYKANQDALMRDMLIWPEGEGEPRDLAADRKACDQALRARPDLANANPLVQLTWGTRCMAEKGWVLNPDAEIPQR